MNSDTLFLICIIFLFWMNVAAFAAYANDKHRATYSQWRIPEATLITMAAAGGAFGALSAMLLFRHKTMHRLFIITVPLCLLAWAGIVAFLVCLT